MTQETLINRIAYFRKLRGMTQKDLSVAIHLNQNYINRLESKKDFFPSTETLFAILEALEVEPEMFFATDFANCIEHKQIVEAASELNEKVYQLLLSEGGPAVINSLVNCAYSVKDKLDSSLKGGRHGA